ncbi:MAG: ABC transporter ATP-binding protein [Chloroflexi bacterium]|nr:ABC transporter ATP-binding protein [Chloroflexota bacterium]
MLEVADLTFSYSGADAAALRGISFHVDKGEIFGILGPSGAGKSTTQKILVGLLRGFQGRVQVLNHNLELWGPHYYERVGVSSELPNHYLKLTALENLNYFRRLYSGPTEDPRALLAEVGLEADADKRVGQFSKGMRVRLNVARALLHRPELLFLDEPTAGLDPVNARRIKDIVRERQARGVTVLLTTHDMMVADELCDRVAFIVDGRIRLIDSPRELKLRHGPRLVRVEYRDGGSVVRKDFALDGLGDNPVFLGLLRSGNVETIHTQETTLDRIFIDVTGKGLE